MSTPSIGFIGLGNMAGAIIRGLRASNSFFETTLYGCDRNQDKRDVFSTKWGVHVLADDLAVAQKSDVLVLAVKPKDLEALLKRLASVLSGERLIISLAAGKSLTAITEALGKNVPLVRALPNINARVQASHTALCANDAVTDAQKALTSALFEAVGSVQWLDEGQLSAYSAISGAGPAFAYLFIDALATAGIQAGLPRPLAQQAACRMLAGSARLVDTAGEHPRALIDQVTSPGGTTIEGMQALTRLGFEHAVQAAIRAVIDKDKQVG